MSVLNPSTPNFGPEQDVSTTKLGEIVKRETIKVFDSKWRKRSGYQSLEAVSRVSPNLYKEYVWNDKNGSNG